MTKLLLSRKHPRCMLVLILEMYTIMDGMSAPSKLINEMLNDSYKPRKFSNFFNFLRRSPLMAKTKMAGERLLMRSMMERG